MVNALFVTLDAGGNLPPALAIAREIVARGGSARFLGHETQRASIEAAGFAFAAFATGRPADASAKASLLTGALRGVAVYADRAIGEDVLHAAADPAIDVVVIDCLLVRATAMAVAAGLPVVSLVHTMWSFFEAAVRGPFGALIALRGTNAARALHSPALSLVTVRDDFETSYELTDRVQHVGVVWQGPPVEARPAPDRRRVLVSLSTTYAPGQAAALQRILDALDGLDLEVVATTGPAIDPASLRAPSNATVSRYVDHAELLPSTSLVVTHGGHGTVARALSHGVPVVVLPMNPLIDQSAIGAAVERLAVGRSLAKSASASRIRSAVLELLESPTHRKAAQRLGASIRSADGAVRAAELIEKFAAR